MSRGSMRRAAVVLSMTVVLLGVSTAVAYAAQHVTSRNISSSSMSLTLTSVGDAGQSHGNQNNGTSPVAVLTGVTGGSFWFNQPVTWSDLAIVDTTDSDSDATMTAAWYARNTGSGFGALTSTSPTAPLTAEGVYNLAVTGTDDGAPLAATATINAAFGIDMTGPTVTTDARRIYAASPAVIDITETDTLSGAENLQYSVSPTGPYDVSWDATPGESLVVPVSISGHGPRTLWWRGFDNAGNLNAGSFSFVIAPTLTLTARPHSGAEENSHIVSFSGTVSSMPVATTLDIVVQRKAGATWHAWKTYVMTLAARATTFAPAAKVITADGSYRARATDSDGTSAWATFTVR